MSNWSCLLLLLYTHNLIIDCFLLLTTLKNITDGREFWMQIDMICFIYINLIAGQVAVVAYTRTWMMSVSNKVNMDVYVDLSLVKYYYSRVGNLILCRILITNFCNSAKKYHAWNTKCFSLSVICIPKVKNWLTETIIIGAETTFHYNCTFWYARICLCSLFFSSLFRPQGWCTDNTW